MATKINLNDPNSGFNSASQLTENNEKIEDHLNNRVLYRNNIGTEANSMQNDLDMNSNDILNAKALNVDSLSINGTQVTAGELAATELPDQSGNSGKFLTTNGTSTSWDNPDSTVFENVVDYGADPTGVSDSIAGFNAAISALGSGGTLHVPAGTYLLSATLDLDNIEGLMIYGAGISSTILKATHSSGPVVSVNARYQSLQNLTITADSARNLGAAGTNYGLLVAPPDTTNVNIHGWTMHNIMVSDQPSHGIVIMSRQFAGRCESFRVQDNLGHGILIDNGTLASYSNNVARSSVEFHNGHINDNKGHAVKCGDDDGSTNFPLRCTFHNIDTFRNALTAGVRKSLHAWWVYAENTVISSCGFGCGDAVDTPTVAALYLAGRDNNVLTPRLIRPLTTGVDIGSITADGISSLGNTVKDFIVSDPSPSSLDPAVAIHADARETVVIANRLTDITSAATEVKGTNWQYSDTTYHHSNHYFRSLASGETRTIADDGFSSIEFEPSQSSGIIVIASNISAGGHALVYYRVGTSPETVLLAGTGAEVTTGALAGTTGTNGKLTISAHTDSKLYIENRTADSRNYSFTLLSAPVTNVMLPAEMTKTS
jgi:hypothetical protein